MNLQRNWLRIISVVVWLVLLGAFLWYIEQHGLRPWSRPLSAVQHLEGLLLLPVGPLLLLIGFLLSSLIFLPSSIFIMVSGFVYGPVVGVLYAYIGFNLAGVVAYSLGRWFGYDAIRGKRAQKLIGRYTDRLGGSTFETFETVVLLRVLTIPLDADAYLAGAVNVPLRIFIPAAAIGAIPSVVAYGLAGASITLDATTGGIGINWWMLALSAAFFIGTLLVSRLVRHYRQPAKQRAESRPAAHTGKLAEESGEG